MKNELTSMLLIAFVMLLSACERRPMYYDDANVRIQFDIDYDIVNFTPGPVPEMMKVEIYNSEDCHYLNSSYMGPEGKDINLLPNPYHMLAYNYDTEFTQVRYENDLKHVEAYTNSINPQTLSRYNKLIQKINSQRASTEVSVVTSYDYSTELVINQPDHLYVSRLSDITVPNQTKDDQIHTIIFPTSTIVKTYRLEIGPISGQENLSLAEAFITGQTQSKFLFSQEDTGVACTLSVPLITSARSNYLTTTFNTFGHSHNDPAYVILHLVDLAGNGLIYECDVTSQFDDPNNVEQVIRVIHEFDIKPPTQEDMSPNLTPWDEHQYEILL